ncbi:glycosyltransferase family 2 protein [Planctomycetota bacterium]
MGSREDTKQRERTRLSVVIPVFLSEPVLEGVWGELSAVLKSAAYRSEVIFVDDGSPDGSWEVLKRLCRGNHDVVLLRLRRNHGQSTAICVGVSWARGDLVGLLDCDLEYPPRELTRLVEACREPCQVVSGWRRGRSEGAPLRTIASKYLCTLMSALCRRRLIDPTSPVKVFPRALFTRVISDRCARAFPQEFLVLGARVVTELPIDVDSDNRRSAYGLQRLLERFVSFHASIAARTCRLSGLTDNGWDPCELVEVCIDRRE